MREDSPEFTMLYDGECPLCVREVAWLKSRDSRGALGLVDISAEGFKAPEYGRTQEELMARMHGITSGGEVVSGVEVFRRAYAAVGLGVWLVPTGWPGLRILFDLAYRVFARFRLPIGRLLRRCQSSNCNV